MIFNTFVSFSKFEKKVVLCSVKFEEKAAGSVNCDMMYFTFPESLV